MATKHLAPDSGVVDAQFISTLETIFNDSVLSEIENVVEDAKQRNGDLQHRGHVIAIALMCALDAISAFGYRGASHSWQGGRHIENFVRNHFQNDYRKHARVIRRLYRNSLIHSWNLFGASLFPGHESVRLNGTLGFGLLNFLCALRLATSDFLTKLTLDKKLQQNTLDRYRALRRTAKA